MGAVLLSKHADGETRSVRYATLELALTVLDFQLDIHRHLGHEIREEHGGFRAIDAAGNLLREFCLIREGVSINQSPAWPQAAEPG
jgi:hypothetical protein